MKKERDELLAREKAARAEAETAQRRLSELSSMSKSFASSMRGVSVERQRARRRLNTQYAVGRILTESDGLEDAAPKVLEAVGEGLGWDLGALWIVDESMDALRCYEVWRAPEHQPSGGADQSGFENASRRTSLPRGSGLPGRVWERCETLWIEDVLEDEGFRRKEAATREGLRKAFAFPIKDGGWPLGVVEFFGREVAPPDEDLLRTASLIGSQLGQFLERRRAEEERERLFARERASRAEAEESRERLREVLESIGDAFFALDRQWRLTYINDRAVSLTSWSREELLGKSISEAFPELVEGMASAELIRTEKEGSATQFEHYSSRLDCWLSYRVYPSPTGLSIYITDITGRKKAEKKLRAREEEYRTTFELAGVGKAQADLETGRFLRVNRRLCEITGYEPGELLAKTFTEITHPEDQDRNYDEFRRMGRGETDEYETEKRYLRKDGAVIWVRLNATAIRDREGRPLRAVATIEDITGRKRADEELKSSEELYRLIADNSTDMISKHTPEGVYTYVSPACRSLLGYEPEELIGHSAYEFFHPEDLETVKRAHSSVLELPDTYIVSYRVRRKDGSYLWFETSSRTIRDSETGAVREIIATSRDVAERKRMEEEKLQLAEHMKLLLESTDEGIYGVDLQGTCSFLNSSAAQMLGYEDPEELLGQDMHEICHHSHNDGSPYPAEEFPIYQAFREERGVRVDDEVFWHRDGSSFPVEYSSSPIIEDGVTRGSIVTFVDITERKRAEEALRKSEERYKALYEDNPFMYFTVDTRGTVLSVNRSGAQQLSYPVEELVGRPMLDLFHEEDREDVSRYFSACAQDLERPTSWEARKMRKDGSIMWVRENVRIVEGSDGNKIVLLLCEDITERKQAEEQILLQAQLLEQVQAAVIATDLQGTVTYWNEYAEELYGWPREEALGRNIMELTVSPEGAKVAEEIMERLRAGETWEGELVVRRKDGSTFSAHVTDSLIYDAQGHAVGVVGVSTDITERKKAEEERGRLLAHEWRARAEAEERKRISRELHDRVAHSMAVVHQSLELYGAIKGRDPEGADRKLALARETTKTALKSTRDLSMTLRNEVEDGLTPALSHLLSTVVPPEIHAEVSVEGDESLAPREVRDQLFLILREGVRNAVSHAEAESISVAVEITPDKIFGSVEDDGRGFDPPELPARAGGGLESMRERAALVGGSLRLASYPDGTRIKVTVPLSRRG
ncbi:MAG: diguanylate cyclase/phosphodiesterase (GGDEF & EAL domains) with PAS/PAC sensor(s) [uncultured Rubrobacteraceae bacterium]|uniref:Diguanylate cyclase/phosphodiesterase (GGDEF & EAL domains) with PAS/PAC sensor(S) n=1 Tax=uncultured Rubrobacteraceae bacterium TaxID=349277 RepID=A0A6J4R6U0_9ACTN|nr:MAG: diguanylate cyclase/phosphodiesterase (GGDEF & EAL domains) with PAS/PAC sensor(s) [uncultured Rubrobacteraceae bacterium]